MKLHLLEPYRSAVMVLAIEENLMSGVNVNIQEDSKAYKAANNESLLQETLQLLTLGDDVSLLWTHSHSATGEEKSNYSYVQTSGLESLDILRLINHKSKEYSEKEWPDGIDFQSIWKNKKNLIDAIYPVVLSQLSSRGRTISIGVFRLIRAYRLGEYNVIPLIYSTLSREEKPIADLILSDDPSVELYLDLPIMGTFKHLCIALADNKINQNKLTGIPFSDTPLPTTKLKPAKSTSTNEVYAIIAEVLLEKELIFPIPQNLKEVNKLRKLSEIASFRQFLSPWMDSIIAGDFNEAKKLKKEIQDCLKAFERYSKVKKIGNFIGYGSIAAGVAEGLSGVFGPSIAGGLVSIGMYHLAEDWKKRSNWLYLTI